ncbi:16S rRNA (cytosine(1402)-N(4))-methyltransferase RsmH [Chloroflexota bacterium]
MEKEVEKEGSPLSHRPVLYQQIINAIRPKPGGYYVDCTLGAGGHASGILRRSSPTGCLLGLEVDPQAISLAKQRLAPFRSRVEIINTSYISLGECLESVDWYDVDGIYFDLGISSMQLDTPERGFSFRVDAPLDMRFDPQNPTRAVDLVNNLREKELADLIYLYGEERRSRQIAKQIINSRPVHTTTQLAEIVMRAKRSGRRSYQRKKAGRKSILHPATRTFQALRIAVNRELESLEIVLPLAVSALTSGGRLAVISFHSLEDRIVKKFFRQESKDCICPDEQPVCTCEHRAILIEVTRKPIRPEQKEIEDNPRSRSARLRIAEKI